MRETTLGGSKLTYPDPTIWLDDNIYIKVTNINGGNSGAKVVVTNMATGVYIKHTYISEINEVVFDLRDTLKSLYTDNLTFTIAVDVYSDNLFDGSFSFTLTTLDGKSIPGRPHGSARTIYMYSPSDLVKVGFIFNNTGSLALNGTSFPIIASGFTQLNLSDVITNDGVYNACFDAGAKGGKSEMDIAGIEDITPFSAVARLEFASGSENNPDAGKGGGVWNDDVFDMDDYCIRIVYDEPCDRFDFFKVRYKDSDGIIRYLGGKIVSDKTSASGENIYRPDLDLPYRNLSKKFITETSETVKVFYSMLRRDAYWGDVLLANNVEFLDINDNWLPCSVITSNVEVKSEEMQDVTLEFELYKS